MMGTRTPTNMDDVIDSRDIIERIEELEAERDAFVDEGGILEDWSETEEGWELKVLEELADEASGSPDWEHGETLIRCSYFKDYAQELAEDCGLELSDQWPARCIDWDQAARELQMDYFSVDFDGVNYWIRS